MEGTAPSCARPPRRFKVVLLGNLGVGKSCLVERADKGYVRHHGNPTINASFIVKTVTLSSGERVQLEIWDTAGQEKYKSLSRLYYRGARGCLLVYDVSNRQSFADLEQWLGDFRSVIDPSCIPFIRVVAAKCDLAANAQQVSVTEAEAWCAQQNVQHWRTSAMTGEGVDALFNRLAEDLASQPEPETFSRVCIVPYSHEKNACCCSIMAPPPPNVVSRLFASLPDQGVPQRRGNDVIAGSVPMMSKQRGTTRLSIDGVERTVGVDLIAAAKSYLRFLDMIEQQHADLLTKDSASLACAFPRYAKFLRLAALYPDRRLYAPPDIELLWKTHLIRPAQYRQEMELLFGHVVDHSELIDEPIGSGGAPASLLAETERLWTRHYGETGPYATVGQTTQTDPAQHADGVAVRLPCGREAPSWQAVVAKISVQASDVEKDARWLPSLRAFVAKNTTEELCGDECALRQWVEGYARFLADCKHALGDLQPQQDHHEGPTYEIDLVWHAHMMHPVVYGRDCQVLGINLNHLPWPTNNRPLF